MSCPAGLAAEVCWLAGGGYRWGQGCSGLLIGVEGEWLSLLDMRMGVLA